MLKNPFSYLYINKNKLGTPSLHHHFELRISNSALETVAICYLYLTNRQTGWISPLGKMSAGQKGHAREGAPDGEAFGEQSRAKTGPSPRLALACPHIRLFALSKTGPSPHPALVLQIATVSLQFHYSCKNPLDVLKNGCYNRSIVRRE